MKNDTPSAETRRLKSARDDLQRGGELEVKHALSGKHLNETLSTIVPDFRDRVFSPLVTLFAFMHQCLSPDKSLKEAVIRVNADRLAQGLEPASFNTSAFSDARKKLPEELPRKLGLSLGQQLEEKAIESLPEQGLYKGRKVIVVDGSTLLMPDTAKNQADYPQFKSQADGCGFPIVRILAAFSLFTGAILHFALSACKGKGTSEDALFRQIIPLLTRGEIVIGDAIFSSYFQMAMLLEHGIDFIFATHGARRVDYRAGKSLGTKDHLIALVRPPKPDWMPLKEYEKIAKKIIIREFLVVVERPGFRAKKLSITTSFTDPISDAKPEIGLLYFCRWSVELYLRDIKTTMGMEMLRSKTPEMIRKEVSVFMLCYNTIRKIMLEAAIERGILPWQVSFKFSVQILRTYSTLWRNRSLDRKRIYQQILDAAGSQIVGKRPGRSEPRRMKRRLKHFKLLQSQRRSHRSDKPCPRAELEALKVQWTKADKEMLCA